MTASACMAPYLARSWANTRDQLDELQPGGEGFGELAAVLHAMESAIAIHRAEVGGGLCDQGGGGPR